MTNYTRYRIYEMLPGIVVWTVLLSGLILSFVKPLWVIYFVILFDLYWVFRVAYFVVYLLFSWRSYAMTIHEDWMQRLATLGPKTDDYLHCIFLPVYNEDEEVVRTTLEALARSSFPAKRMIVVLAGEERQLEHFNSIAPQLKKEFEHNFYSFIVTVHPKDLPGEIPGKGSNIHYAGNELKRWFDERGIVYERVIVSSFDIDTIVHKHYFAYLTYLYANHPNPTHASFQPVALFNNNIWESSAPLRIMAFGTTFYLLFAFGRPEIMTTFSSHSMSFKALVDVGFWQKNIVSEDSRIFFQCWLRYGGDYEVVPMFLPVSMDTVNDPSFKKSMVNLYKQQRRWAWGVEHIPFLLWHLPQHTEIPFGKRLHRMWTQWEGKFSWCTTSLFILVFGRLPLLVAGDEVRSTVLFQNTPHILEWLMLFSMAGMVFSMVLSLKLLPPLPQTTKKRMWIFMLLQWALVPVSLICFSAIPAIDATTRLMFGRYLGFNVSQKKRSQLMTIDEKQILPI
ncbi:MAG: glycosyltransferase family 2 protein [Candidatus Magasanikbacteria bacterium]|nr:glycosyltransferase family 2 protein [Candidatus Magasanikbacteria bacterium]